MRMPETPTVQPLSYRRRTWFFRMLLFIFLVTVPVFIFYAMGYRVDIFNKPGNISAVGGMFISTDPNTDTQIFINDELISNYRLFQKAAYIQDLPAGIQEVHVQGDGLQTWKKELPVYPHIVTEAAAFNLPEVPQVRVITSYTTSLGEAVVWGGSSTLPASTTVQYRNQWVATSSHATSSLVSDQEYEYLATRFASSTSEETLFDRVTQELSQFTFGTSATTTEEATSSTKVLRDRTVEKVAGGLLVTWIGSDRSVPYYFCVPNDTATSTMALYDLDTRQALAAVYEAQDVPMTSGSRTCRQSIKVGDDGEKIYTFDFYPNDPDLLILHRSDGVVVKEIDDRAWQNTQVLYPAGEYDFLVDGSRFFIKWKKSGIIFELLPTLAR